MKSVKSVFCLCLSIIFCAVAFAEESEFNYSDEWYVCVGSYKVKQNALNRVQQLNEYDIETFYSEASVEGEKFYRIITKDHFDTIQEARNFRDKLAASSNAELLGLKGLWVCHRMIKKTATKLEVNSSDENFFTEEKPYSVVINTYKEESVAQADKERLKEKEIDSYIVKKYDEEELFSFDLNSGSYETKEEAELQKEKIKEAGITTKEVVNFNDEVEAIKNYDKVVQNEEIVFNSGTYDIPEIFTENVQTVLNNFPVNKFYQIEEAYIFDLENCRKNNFLYDTENFISVFIKNKNIKAFTYVLYNDELFDKQVTVCMFETDKEFKLSEKEDSPFMTQDFKIKDGVLNCEIYKTEIEDSKNDKFILYGQCPEQNLYLYMYSEKFTQEEFLSFLDSNYEGTDLLIYPQMRRTLLVLPDETSNKRRDFCAFDLKKVNWDYAREKGYTDWAIPIVGHWNATAYLVQDSEQINVGFFDLDYDYNAQNIHQIFMNEKNTFLILNDNNHPQEINDVTGWYLNNNGKEFSFSTKSYIIAIDAEKYSSLNLDELYQVASDLKIWK